MNKQTLNKYKYFHPEESARTSATKRTQNTMNSSMFATFRTLIPITSLVNVRKRVENVSCLALAEFEVISHNASAFFPTICLIYSFQ